MPDKLEKSCHVGKVVQPLQSVKSIRIAASAVMDMLAKPLQVRFLVFDFKRLHQMVMKWKLGRCLVIGGYPSPFMCECYLTIKLRIYKMNFSYRITALELSTSI